MTVANIRNMQDLYDNLDELGYSASVINQIRPRIRDCAKIYNRPLCQIDADYDAFVARWGTGHVAALAAGFKSRDHFVEWRKRVRGALSRVHVKPTKGAPILADWQAVLAAVAAHSGPKKPLGPHREHGVKVVAECASAEGLRPQDLTDEAISRIAAPLRTKTRRTFKRGIDTMNDLFEYPEIMAQLQPGFPAMPLAQPARVKSVPSTRRRGGPNASSEFWKAFDAFVARKRGRDDLGRPLPAKQSEFKPRTAQTYENALNNATGVLERAGVLLPGDMLTLRDLCSVETITRVADLWQVRMLDGEVDKEAATLHLTVERLSHIAVYSKFLRKKDRKKLQRLRDKVRKKAKRRGRMSAPREAWIKTFSRSTPQQLAVHGMPEALMREAQKILDDWDRLKNAKKHKIRMRALHLGIAAVQAAILFRGSAVRASNLRGLPFRGEDAQLFLGQGEQDVRLSIPAALVKNGVDIEADFDDDARSVIDWYLREIRPRLVKDHPYGHNLADGDWLFPSKRADRPMEETTFADHYRVGVEAVGLDMTLHQSRHITVYFILDEDPSALALAAAVLGDDISTVEAHYAWMDGVKAVIDGRKLLQESRKKARKHVKGGR
jgi:hypothetical protein